MIEAAIWRGQLAVGTMLNESVPSAVEAFWLRVGSFVLQNLALSDVLAGRYPQRALESIREMALV